MKWTIEKDKELEDLISQGFKHNILALKFGLTPKAISNRCFRLKLNIVHDKQYVCLNCKAPFYDLISTKRKFCSSSCFGQFNMKGKKRTKETKTKIANSMRNHVKSEESKLKISGINNPNWIDGRSISTRTKKIEGKKKCIYCNEFKVEKKYKSVCDECRFKYYKAYRPSCEFKFNLNDFKEEFDFSLIDKYGWYNPTNKKNNLNGISRDHLYSVKDGFINKIDANIISHPANCKLIKHSQNSSKNSTSNITLEVLKEKIEKWNKKYNLNY